MNKADLLELLKIFKIEQGEKFGLISLGLFGSFAKGEETESSDIDLVVEIAKPDMFLIVHMKDELEHLLHRSVDIVRYRKRMNRYLKKHIDNDTVYV